MAAILGKFAETCAKQVDLIDSFLEAGELASASREAHSLKGAAASVCASRMQAMAAAIETAPGKISKQDRQDFRAAVTQTRAWIEERFPQP